MPARLRTPAGRTVSLGPEVARGGEASIHEVDGSPGVLAKVYAAPGEGIGDKLRWMQARPPRERSGVEGHRTIAWPTELLLGPSGSCAGYLMPRIDGAVPLLDVINPRRRARVLPGFDHAYSLRAARNLAAALASVHDAGTVVGDLHERNVLVTPRALVTVIDADSFQVARVAGHAIVVHPCPVGRAEYTPPELQGQAFREVIRTPAHDAFGLAVLIFQLLHGGSHPYRGRWLGDGEAPPVEERIRRGWFPWAPLEGTPVAPPPGVPPLTVLDPAIRRALRSAFVDGHTRPALRPAAADWERILGCAEADVVRCPVGHAHPGHLDRCPRCGARRGALAALVRRIERVGVRAARERPSPPDRSERAPAAPADAASRRPSVATRPTAAAGRAPLPGAAAARSGAAVRRSPPPPAARSGAPPPPARSGGPPAAAGSAVGPSAVPTSLIARFDAARRRALAATGAIGAALVLATLAAAAVVVAAGRARSPEIAAMAAAAAGHLAAALAGASSVPGRRAAPFSAAALLAPPIADATALLAAWLAASALPALAGRIPTAQTAPPGASGPIAAWSGAWLVGFALYGALTAWPRGRERSVPSAATLAPSAAAGAAGWLAAWALAGLAR